MKQAKSPSMPPIAAEAAAMVAHLQQRREEERSRLSRMLHHDVSGMLAAARMDLSRLSARVKDEDAQESLRRIDHLLDQVIRDARREMQRLHPALLDHFGLPLAIRHLIEESCRARDVQYTVALDETMDGVDADILIATFRLVETLLGDCARLGEFSARLTARRDGYVLELMRVLLAGSEADGADSTLTEDVEALRTWLRSLGAAWLESAQGERSIVELRIPRRVASQPSETPGG